MHKIIALQRVYSSIQSVKLIILLEGFKQKDKKLTYFSDVSKGRGQTWLDGRFGDCQWASNFWGEKKNNKAKCFFFSCMS